MHLTLKISSIVNCIENSFSISDTNSIVLKESHEGVFAGDIMSLISPMLISKTREKI